MYSKSNLRCEWWERFPSTLPLSQREILQFATARQYPVLSLSPKHGTPEPTTAPYQVPTPALTPALTPKSKVTPQSAPLDLNPKPATSLVPLKRGNDKVTTHPRLYQHNKYNAR